MANTPAVTMATRTAAATAARFRHSDCQNGTFFTWSAASFSGWRAWSDAAGVEGFFSLVAALTFSPVAGRAVSAVTFGAAVADAKASSGLSFALGSAAGAGAAPAALPNV